MKKCKFLLILTSLLFAVGVLAPVPVKAVTTTEYAQVQFVPLFLGILDSTPNGSSDAGPLDNVQIENCEGNLIEFSGRYNVSRDSDVGIVNARGKGFDLATGEEVLVQLNAFVMLVEESNTDVLKLSVRIIYKGAKPNQTVALSLKRDPVTGETIENSTSKNCEIGD